MRRAVWAGLMWASSSALSAADCASGLVTAMDAGEPIHRCMHDWLREVFADAQCGLTVRRGGETSPNRRLADVEAGRLDFMFQTTPRPERESYGLFSVPYGVEQTRIFIRATDQDRWPIKSLCDDAMRRSYGGKGGLRVLGPAQGWHGAGWQAVREGAACGRVSFYTDAALKARTLLLAGRADVLVAPNWMMLGASAQMRAEVVPLAVWLSEDIVGLMYSRRRVEAATVAQLDAALNRRLALSGPPCDLGMPAAKPD